MDLAQLDALERLSALLRIEQRKYTTAHGLQMVHHDILDFLARCNRYSDTLQSVTEFLGQTKGTISQSIKLLEAKGFISRHRDLNDGRVQHLRLTDKGQEYVWGGDALSRGLFEGLSVNPSYGKIFGTILNDILWQIQMRIGHVGFSLCRTCRHNQPQPDGGFLCGLTSEALSVEDTQKICREHRAVN